MGMMRRGRARLLAIGVALVFVLAAAGVALVARALLTPTVSAATPPDAVRVVVSHDTRLGHDANGAYLILAHPIHTIRFQGSITDPLTVNDLRALLNAPADGKTPLPTCDADSPAATTPALPAYLGMDTYDFVFTAHGVTVEHVVISFRCGGAGVRRGFAPARALGGEGGLGPNWWQIFPDTIWPVGGPYTTPLVIHK